MVEDVAGKDALPFFPYIFTLFMFILMANFLGLIPMSLHHHLAYRGHGDPRWRRSSSR
jgi:F0F1-type ATP synthase membrane subunit a